MTEKYSELRDRLVVGRKRDGRCVYDEDAKLELVRACLRPGASVARTAMQHGVNANLLRTWIAAYQQRSAMEPPTVVAQTPDAAFIAVRVEAGEGKDESVLQSARAMTVPAVVIARSTPVVAIADEEALPPPEPALAIGLHVRLPNGVEFDLGEASLPELSSVVQMLGRLPCSASTKG